MWLNEESERVPRSRVVVLLEIRVQIENQASIEGSPELIPGRASSAASLCPWPNNTD